ncbi:MAG TPA: SDR family NAD(P)-dependent oxidoreductase, partial [Candidatus Angelobacter sp.]|nr:SDR family NAD(P)-dependent oxidoreductase [Candidatus Angelobacter sp.]
GEGGRCGLGSVKSNVGHLDAAAGVTGLIKVVLSLQHGMLAPSLHYQAANPEIDFAGTPFYVNTELRKWERGETPLRAGVSAFGVGGTNAHVVVEEAPEQAPEQTGEKAKQEWQLLVVSGRTEKALQEGIKNLGQHLGEHGEQELGDVAYTLQVGRQRFGYRHTVVSRSREEAIAGLEQGWEGQGEEGANEPGVVFLYPGQGAQQVGMGWELYGREAVYRRSVEECSEILRPYLGMEVKEYLKERGEERGGEGKGAEEMEQTWLAQPLLVTMEYGLSQLWKSWGVEPQALLGHSLGEYTAAIVAGVMSLEEGLRLVAERGRLMQATAPGGMLAISLAAEQVERWMGGGMTVAAINGAELCTVAGGKEEIMELEQELREQGVTCQRLRTSHGFHSGLVEPALGPYGEEVRKVKMRAPRIPFVSNVSGTWIGEEEAQTAEYWVKQMRAPVRFDEGLQTILREGGRVLLEVGPGQTLRRLAMRQPEARRARLLLSTLPGDDRSSQVRSLLSTVGRLWEAGTKIDWAGFHAGERRRRIPLPTYPFQRQRYWIHPASHPRSAESRAALPKVAKNKNVFEWFWTPSWKLSNLLPIPAGNLQAAGAWIVFVDEEGLGWELVRRLEHQQQEVIAVAKGACFKQRGTNRFSIDPASLSDYKELFEVIGESGKPHRNIIHLWATESAEKLPEEIAFEQYQSQTVYSLLCLIQTLAPKASGTAQKLWVVATKSVSVESSDTLAPEKSGLLAICRIAQQEHDGLSCSVIDVQTAETPAGQLQVCDHLMKEVSRSQMDSLIAYRGRNRWLQNFEQAALQPGDHANNPLRPGGVYLITGGLGAVGLMIAQHLATKWKAKLALVGRSTLPARVEWPDILERQSNDLVSRRISALIALEQESEVEILNADVADYEAMRASIERCYERFGVLDGVIHAAGITNGPTVFCSIRELNPEAFAIQARPKVRGMYVLHRILRDKDIPFVLALSSNAAVLGGLGFAAYAAANAFMDAFANQKAADGGGTRWISAAWDHWPQETKQLTQFHTSLDDFAMTGEEAMKATELVLENCGSGQIVVATGNLNDRLNIWSNPGSLPDNSQSASGPTSLRNTRPLLAKAYIAPRNDLERQLAAIWEEFFGLDRVGIQDDFFELGGHSLLATKLISKISSAIKAEVPLRKLFEGPTVAALSEAISQLSAD